MNETFGQILLFLFGLTIEIGVPVFWPKAKQKQLVRLLGALVILMAVAWITYTLGQSQAETTPPPQPKNVTQRFDFESGIGSSISLDVCDAIPPTYYENCYGASSKLLLSNHHFTGKYSLGYEAELLPAVERVFSVNIPVYPPARVDAVSANIHLPDSIQPTRIWLLVRVNGEDRWKFSEIKNTGSGWTHLYLDLQKTVDAAGVPVSQKGIDEVDIDVFLPKAPQQMTSVMIEMDDIELYYPSSKILDSP